MIFLLILLLLIIIIINIIISNSENEDFATEPDKLIYLFDKDSVCPNCQDFNTIWSNIENQVKNNYLYYKFITIKYNMDTDKDGQTIAKDNKINTPPAIVYKSGKNYYVYVNKSKEIFDILEWARKINQ